MKYLKRYTLFFIILLLANFTLHAQTGPLPPTGTNGYGTNDNEFISNVPPYVFPTNGLWLWITNVANQTVYANLNGATDFVYEIYGKSDLTAPIWNIETEVFPGINTNVMPFTVPMNDQNPLFLWARDWTGITSNGNTTPEWWFYYYFGTVALSDTNLDSVGGTYLYDYENDIDPNVIQFSLEATNNYIANVSVPLQLNIFGGISDYIAVVVDDTNYEADANWQTYTSSNITVNLGSTPGWHNIWVGLRGMPTNALQTWQSERVKLDTTPPVLIVTNPVVGTVSVPMIQLQGYCPEDLACISYNLTNAAGVLSNQQVLVLNRFYDTNTFEFTTNTFQGFDIPLTNGLNTITLVATDNAGNVTSTNYSFTVDYSTKTNAPIVNLYWPQNQTAVCCTNYTWRGWVADPTVTMAAQTVDTNGNTNSFNAIVERDGNFWVENMPLSNGTNYLTLCVTDVVGNVTITNITVFSSDLALTITPPSPDAMWAQGITVNGTISDSSDYTLWVNGVEAILNGDGTWTATNVYIPTAGVAVIQARAIPNTDNGGNGTGGSGGGAVSYDALGNPVSSQTSDAEIQTNKPMQIFVQQYTDKEKSETVDIITNYDQYGNIAPDGDGMRWYVNDTTTTYTVDWVNGSTGNALDDDYVVGAINEANVVSSGSYEHLNPIYWPTGWWPNIPDGTMYEWDGETETFGSPVIFEHCDMGVPLADQTDSTIFPGYDGNYTFESLQTTGNRQAQAIIRLQTGGKADPRQSNLCRLSATATQLVPGRDPLFHNPTNPVKILPVPPQNITVYGKALGSDGNLWILLPGNTDIDITPKANGLDYYTFSVNAAKYALTIVASSDTTNADLTTDTPTFCVGQQVTFTAQWDVDPKPTSVLCDWILPDKYVNDYTIPDDGNASIDYFLNTDLLHEYPSTQCWYVNKPGGVCNLGLYLTFANGQQVVITRGGSINIYRPTLSTFYSQPPFYAALVPPDSPNELQLGDVTGDGSMFYQIKVNSTGPFSGGANITQLINASRAVSNSLGGQQSTTDGEYWLDNTFSYNVGDSSLSAPIYWSWVIFSDQPGYGLNYIYGLYPVTLCTINDSFKDYIIFRPDGSNNIYVTLGRVFWNWSAATTKVSGVWQPPTYQVNGPSSPDESDEFATWPDTYFNSN